MEQAKKEGTATMRALEVCEEPRKAKVPWNIEYEIAPVEKP